MKLTDLNFHLPPEQIAQRPPEERDSSRMLLLDRASGAWEERPFRELPGLFHGDELIVLNNARVLPARLFGRREGRKSSQTAGKSAVRNQSPSGVIEVLLVRQLEPAVWEALVRPGRKVPIGERLVFADGELEAEVLTREDFGLRALRFTSKGEFHETLRRLGRIPLPPYIQRDDDEADRLRYQTVYAQKGSAVAAPTAGLHFTPDILGCLRGRGIEIAEVTLDVGLGTFEPVRTEILEEHKIHKEAYEITNAAAAAIARAKNQNRPVLAIGTTVVRTLEDAAEKGAGAVKAGRADAEIFLYPGKPFRIVDQLLTNFHLPQSSLLGLVAAFAGRENVLRAYRHAVDAKFRFYSYGDCMLIR